MLAHHMCIILSLQSTSRQRIKSANTEACTYQGSEKKNVFLKAQHTGFLGVLGFIGFFYFYLKPQLGSLLIDLPKQLSFYLDSPVF